MVTQSRLKELFTYNSGNLIYINSRGGMLLGSVAGTKSNTGYFKIHIDGKLYLLHRIIFLYHYGFIPKYLDHINNIKEDNRIENLREATHSQNNANKSIMSTNKSGYKGVVWHKASGKWAARICIDYKNKHLGLFDSKDAANEAYKKASLIHFKEFSNFNETYKQ